MSEMKASATIEVEPRHPGESRRAPVAFGAVLVAVGLALLLEQVGALPTMWRASVWPVLLMAFGAARLLQVTSRGREGLFFVVAGAWWLAGLQGWVSPSRTWPLLLVGLGASIVLQTLTTPPRDATTMHQFGRRHGGAATWMLLAILAGALLTSGRGPLLTAIGEGRDRQGDVLAVAGRAEHSVRGAGFRSGDLVAVMGRSVLDLSEAQVSPGETVRVDVMTVMGNGTIRVPADWTVDVEAVAAFGAVHDNREFTRDFATGNVTGATADGAAPPRLRVDGMVMMGSLLITH